MFAIKLLYKLKFLFFQEIHTFIFTYQIIAPVYRISIKKNCLLLNNYKLIGYSHLMFILTIKFINIHSYENANFLRNNHKK